MARLQDFQTVTPTSSDNILIVQPAGQGLAPYSIKMDSANPTGTGSLSINRKANTTTGENSVAVGTQVEASGVTAVATGNTTTASGNMASANGYGTVANHRSQFVFGEWNTADASTAASTAKGNYIEVVGKGTSAANRSNARTLDWSGNEVLAGGLKLHGNQDAATISVISSFASGDTLNCASYSDGAIVFLYRPQEGMVGIYAKANGWARMVPIISISTVSINGLVLTNNGSSTLVGTVISS